MIELSLSEIDALVLKAYRGAGFSWGMAQEAGKASAWLACHGLPAAALFDSLLSRIDSLDASRLTPLVDNRQWHCNEHPLCPVVTGTVLSDWGLLSFSTNRIELGVVYNPGVLLPFAAACATTARCTVQLQCHSDSLLITESGLIELSGFGFFSMDSAEVSISKTTTTPVSSTCSHSASQRRASVSDAAYERLRRLAHRTYVPASEQSRATGAGAGLTDND